MNCTTSLVLMNGTERNVTVCLPIEFNPPPPPFTFVDVQHILAWLPFALATFGLVMTFLCCIMSREQRQRAACCTQSTDLSSTTSSGKKISSPLNSKRRVKRYKMKEVHETL